MYFLRLGTWKIENISSDEMAEMAVRTIDIGVLVF